MADVFDTAFLDEAMMKTLTANQASWIYNGLDCCVTAEIYNVLQEEINSDPEVQETYATALDKLAPYMEMELHGVYINKEVRDKKIKELTETYNEVREKFDYLCTELFDGPFNPASPMQIKSLFYTCLGFKEIKKRNSNGIFAATVNEEALEKLKVHLFALPFCNMILIMRGISKSLGFLRTQIDEDSRIRTGYNIAGTNTGRLSSAYSDFGSGTNLQNVDRSLREPFEADPGMIFLNIDLEQADARNVGARLWETFYDYDAKDIARLLGKKSWTGAVGPEFAGHYLDACEGGDLHTTVSRMCWPNLAWPEDPAEWKKFCDGIMFHRQDSYRQSAKKLGHGTNYFGKPPNMAAQTHIPTILVKAFQDNYFEEFPAIPAWHAWVINKIEETGVLYNLFGRRRHFFGRGNDASTWRAAIAYDPQSSTGEEIDRGLLQVYRHFPSTVVQPLLQVHDSILFQIPYSEHADLIPEILNVMQVNKELKGGRMFHVPLEAQIGWNWGKYDYDNPNVNPYGLVKWKGKADERNRPAPIRRFKDYL